MDLLPVVLLHFSCLVRPQHKRERERGQSRRKRNGVEQKREGNEWRIDFDLKYMLENTGTACMYNGGVLVLDVFPDLKFPKIVRWLRVLNVIWDYLRTSSTDFDGCLLRSGGPSARAATVAFGAGFGAGGSYYQNQQLVSYRVISISSR